MDKEQRWFHWLSRGWYHRKGEYPESISFGYHSEEISGEIIMEWVELSGKQVPKLQSFNDSWAVLASFADLLEKLADVDSDNISQEEFVEILKSCNFEDLTEYNSPYTPNESKLRLRLREIDQERKDILEKLKE